MNRRVVKHLAFALIGAAVVAEVLAVSVFAAASSSSASLWTSTPIYQAHFTAIAACNSASDTLAQLIAALF
jgi:hypothetical protein